MIGLDVNVLVRYIMQDDPKQSPKATRLVECLTSEQPGFVPLVAVVELVWVLSSSCGLSREQLVEALDLLLRSKEPDHDDFRYPCREGRGHDARGVTMLARHGRLRC